MTDEDRSFARMVLERLESIQAATVPVRFFSIKAAAEFSSLSEDSIRRLVERGDLTALRPVNGKVLIDRLELEQVILGSASSRPTAGRGIRHQNGRKKIPGHQEAKPEAG